jgi:Holliday junction DNA helicase RuvA
MARDYVILDVGGVGYQVHCASRTLQALPQPGGAAVLSIETYVREDQIKAVRLPQRSRA